VVRISDVALGVTVLSVISLFLVFILLGALRSLRCIESCRDLGYDDGDYNKGCYCLAIERVPLEALEGVTCEDRLVGR
jgi:hypothetical protein